MLQDRAQLQLHAESLYLDSAANTNAMNLPLFANPFLKFQHSDSPQKRPRYVVVVVVDVRDVVVREVVVPVREIVEEVVVCVSEVVEPGTAGYDKFM